MGHWHWAPAVCGGMRLGPGGWGWGLVAGGNGAQEGHGAFFLGGCLGVPCRQEPRYCNGIGLFRRCHCVLLPITTRGLVVGAAVQALPNAHVSRVPAAARVSQGPIPILRICAASRVLAFKSVPSAPYEPHTSLPAACVVPSEPHTHQPVCRRRTHWRSRQGAHHRGDPHAAYTTWPSACASKRACCRTGSMHLSGV